MEKHPKSIATERTHEKWGNVYAGVIVPSAERRELPTAACGQADPPHGTSASRGRLVTRVGMSRPGVTMLNTCVQSSHVPDHTAGPHIFSVLRTLPTCPENWTQVCFPEQGRHESPRMGLFNITFTIMQLKTDPTGAYTQGPGTQVRGWRIVLQEIRDPKPSTYTRDPQMRWLLSPHPSA